MQKLSLLVATTVIALGCAYSATAQAPSKAGAKAIIQAPALVSAKGNLGSFARLAPDAQAWSAQASLGAMAKVADAQAAASTTASKMGALVTSPAAASSAKAGMGSLVNAALASGFAGKASMSAAANTPSAKFGAYAK